MNTKKTEVIQPEGNYYDKYHSTNPIVKWMMKGFMNSIRELLEATEIRFQQVCETGCGEGEITSFIKKLYPEAEIDAFDISRKVIAEARERIKDINFYIGNIYTMEVYNGGEHVFFLRINTILSFAPRGWNTWKIRNEHCKM